MKNGWEAFKAKPKSKPAADVMPETRQDGSGPPRGGGVYGAASIVVCDFSETAPSLSISFTVPTLVA